MIPMEVGGLGFDPRNFSPLVLLKDKEELNFLPIWIGIFEATSIAMELQGVKPPRPMTHDLLKDLIDKYDSKITRIIINDVKEGTFYATVEIETKDGKKGKPDRVWNATHITEHRICAMSLRKSKQVNAVN